MSGSSYLTAFTRLGFAARGLLYIVIAWLVFTSGRSEDASGALSELSQSGGKALLLVMAAGFVAYGLWRVSADCVWQEPQRASCGRTTRCGARSSAL